MTAPIAKLAPFMAALACLLLGASCGGRPTLGPTPGPVAEGALPVDNCDHEAQAVLGVMDKNYDSEEEFRRDLAGHMFFPGPGTLPEGARFTYGLYHANNRLDDFMQTTFQLQYTVGEGPDLVVIEAYFFNSIVPVPEPPESPHTVVKINGKTGYQFKIDHGKGYIGYNVTRREVCRYLTVSIAGRSVKPEEALAIAEGMTLEPPR